MPEVESVAVMTALAHGDRAGGRSRVDGHRRDQVWARLRRGWHGWRVRLALAALAAMVSVTVLGLVAPVTRTAASAGPATVRPTPAWAPQARAPFPGGPTDRLNQWLATGESASRALPSEHPSVLFVGDSITQWWQTNGRASWDRWFAPIGAADDGVVADTTSNVLARIDAGQLPRTSPRVVVVMIGTNNIALSQSPAEIVRGIQAVISALHSRLPGSRMVVLGLLPRGGPGDAYRRATEDVNRLLRRSLRSPATTYLDVGPVLLGANGDFLPGSMLADLLHPAPAGYALMAGPILRAIEAARPDR